MDIVYGNNVIKRRCQRAVGKLKRRLDDIRAAESLDVLRTLPGRYHALSANRAGQWACDLEGPHRLIFAPIRQREPDADMAAGSREQATAVRLIEVVDYHER
jgi:proteic killer suppression protein